ncbi:hypothetical protein T439DRAFT_329902 [Meredithblackwellia eburnea MCA 4105]
MSSSHVPDSATPSDLPSTTASRPCLATLPTELKLRLIRECHDQDWIFWYRMVVSYFTGHNLKVMRALPQTDPAWWFGRSLLGLSLVSKEFAELSKKLMFKVVLARRCYQPVLPYSILYKHSHLIEKASIGGQWDRHIFMPPHGDGGQAGTWSWQDTKSVSRLFDQLPLLPNLHQLEFGTTAAATLFGLLREVRSEDDEPNDEPLSTDWDNLPSSHISHCNDRRAALRLLAPRITDLAIIHSPDERDESPVRQRGRVPLPTLILAVPLFRNNLTTLRFNFDDCSIAYDHTLAIAQCHQLKNLYLTHFDGRFYSEKAFEPLLRPSATGETLNLSLKVPPVEKLVIDNIQGIYPVKFIRIFRKTLQHLALNPFHGHFVDVEYPEAVGDLFGRSSIVEEEKRDDEVLGQPSFPVLKKLQGVIPPSSVHKLFEQLLGDVSGSLKEVVLDFHQTPFMAKLKSKDTVIFACKYLRQAAPLARIKIEVDRASRTKTRKLVHDGCVEADQDIEPPPLGVWKEWFSSIELNILKERGDDALFETVGGEMARQLDWVVQRLARARLAGDRDGVAEIGQWMGKINSRFMWEMD